MRSVWTCSSQSIHRWVLYNQSGVFTARYAMSPCTKRSSFLFKRLHSTACYMFRSRQNRPQAIHTKHLNHSSSSCSANTVTRRDGVAQKEPQVGVYLYLTFPRSLPLSDTTLPAMRRFFEPSRILRGVFSFENVLP